MVRLLALRRRGVERLLRMASFRLIRMSSIGACPYLILSPSHYRADETCRCDDPDHVEMKEWGFWWDGARWAGRSTR